MGFNMKTKFNSVKLFKVIFFILINFIICSSNSQTVFDYQSSPPFIGGNGSPPQVLLSMSVDHQLFFKAYNDFDDINGDGSPDITYNKSIEYIGYFDSKTCYDYKNDIFEPSTPAVDGYYCNKGDVSGLWSGNFMNWASMTRIDVVRKILYGGYRSTDTDKETVLERSHLTSDAHSFAKYYNGADLKYLTPFKFQKTGIKSIDSGVTFCNTTVDLRENVASHKSDRPPLIRAVKGNYSFWPAGERWQCLYHEEQKTVGNLSNNSAPGVLSSFGIYASHQLPKKSDDQIYDYYARIKICTTKSDKIREECIKYPSGNYKPIGLVQKYGQSGEIEFGLLSGSYSKNKSGGMLRKNIGPISDEINVATDGTYKNSLAGGGIVKTIDSFRLANWYAIYPGDSRYGTYVADSCLWGKNSFSDGECTNWGNPFSEILLESYRYFSGASPTTGYLGDDTFVSSDLAQVPWKETVTKNNYCSNLNILAFNSSTISYDGEALDSTSLGTTSTIIKSRVNDIGDQEGITGNQFFVGSISNKNDDFLCTAKKVSSLSSVRGTCPDAPRLEGSYYSSGLAFYAKTNDINPKIDGDQSVDTFGFSLAPAVPKVIMPRPGQPNRKVTIFPACRNNSIKGNCSIVDFKIIEPHNDDNGDGTYTGMMYVTWEDSEQGGDFDQDLNGVIRYEINAERITVSTRVVGNSTPFQMGFGFVINGVTASDRLNGKNIYSKPGNGFHVLSGTKGYTGGNCNDCQAGDDWKSKRFIVYEGKAEFLEQPLYYVSKYGGFKDLNGNNIPDLQSEWDSQNNFTGEPKPDGIPDNYHNVNNPRDLKISFEKVISEILASAASGTGSSVVTNAGDGAGLFLQSLFYPSLNFKGNEISWVSTLNGMFMDENNYVREDSNNNATLDNTDDIVEIVLDDASRVMKAQRYIGNVDGTKGAKKGDLISLHDLKPVWSAHQQLAKVEDPITQRSYVTSSLKQRHILTAIDSQNDGIISNANELKPFSASTFATNGYLLNHTDPNKLINFIRGQDYLDLRSRSADILPGANLEVWRLGDIASSTPLIVGAPKVGFDAEFSDKSYRNFRQHYSKRRTVVYAAANDGMLHAFNGGFFDSNKYQYSTDQHPLGSELWGYVPYNLLPHLKWLADFNYPHVPYMDGELKSFDVNIFPDDADHPGGWGTILVAGMRFGGGPITVSDGKSASNDRTARSAWVILDITNPDKPPKLVAEVTHKDIGFTTSNADVVKFRSKGKNGWYLTFGSGPNGKDAAAARTAQKFAVSDQTAKVFLFDLKTKTLASFDTGIPNAFVGGVHATDWNRDFHDDVLYYGLVAGTPENPAGQLRRALLTSSNNSVSVTDSLLLDVADQPFSAPPTTRIDQNFNYWVFAGTGRFFHDTDGLHKSKNSFYAIKEQVSTFGNLGSSTIQNKSLIDVTSIQTFTNGDVRHFGGGQVLLNTGDKANTVKDVESIVDKNNGWRLDLPNDYARNIGPASIYSTSLLFTAFTPTDDLCSGDVGNTRLYQREFFNGLSPTYSAVTIDVLTSDNGTEIGKAIPESINLGDNFYSESNEEGLTQSNEGELKQIDLGKPNIKSRREAWREVDKDW